MVVAELEKTLSGCPAVDSVVSLLDGVVEKLSVLKRKVSVASGPSRLPPGARAAAWVRGPGLTVCRGRLLWDRGHGRGQAALRWGGGLSGPECGRGEPLHAVCALRPLWEWQAGFRFHAPLPVRPGRPGPRVSQVQMGRQMTSYFQNLTSELGVGFLTKLGELGRVYATPSENNLENTRSYCKTSR